MLPVTSTPRISSISLFVMGWRYATIASVSREARPSLLGRSSLSMARTYLPQLGTVCMRYVPPVHTSWKPHPATSSAFSSPFSAWSISREVQLL